MKTPKWSEEIYLQHIMEMKSPFEDRLKQSMGQDSVTGRIARNIVQKIRGNKENQV